MGCGRYDDGRWADLELKSTPKDPREEFFHKGWSELPKGPAIDDVELLAIKNKVLAGKALSKKTIRRLIQTLERHRFNQEIGYTEKLPPIGSIVYDSNGFDSFRAKVLKHLPTGALLVAFIDENNREEVLVSWDDEPSGL